MARTREHDEMDSKLGGPQESPVCKNGATESNLASSTSGKPEEEVGHCVICQKSTKLKCKDCKHTFYCDREHQKLDWKDGKHKQICRPAKLAYNDEIGNHLLATKDIEKGAIVFTVKPLIVLPYQVNEFSFFDHTLYRTARGEPVKYNAHALKFTCLNCYSPYGPRRNEPKRFV